DDLAERHHAFWTSKNIQEFWAGTSFHQPGGPNELSYSLAEILVQLLAKDRDSFLEFVRHAHYSDAGLTAAYDCLGCDLGDMAAPFPGEGNWRPNRKAIADLWKSAKRATEHSNDEVVI